MREMRDWKKLEEISLDVSASIKNFINLPAVEKYKDGRKPKDGGLLWMDTGACLELAHARGFSITFLPMYDRIQVVHTHGICSLSTDGEKPIEKMNEAILRLWLTVNRRFQGEKCEDHIQTS